MTDKSNDISTSHTESPPNDYSEFCRQVRAALNAHGRFDGSGEDGKGVSHNWANEYPDAGWRENFEQGVSASQVAEDVWHELSQHT